MALPFALPENVKVIEVAPIAAANAMVYDIVSCKHAHKVWFIVQHTGTSDTDMVLSLVENDDVAATTSAAVTKTFPIWVDADTSSGDALTKQTDAASYTIDTGAGKNQLVIIEWDPAKHTSGYDCIQLADTGGNASNNAVAWAIIVTRYPQATPPSAIID